jgi:Flp pilus assembly protein TadG
MNIIGDRRGSISIIAALSFVAVIGVAALAVDYGRVLMQRSENQRIADLAAYGGALVYNATGSTDDATAAAGNIATLNGLANPSANLVTSPTGDGHQAMQVSVTTNVPLYLARVLTADTAVPVTASASAEIKADAPGCIIALGSGGTGLTMNGGTHITSATPGPPPTSCAVASNSTVSLDGGAQLVTKDVDYQTSYSVSGGALITAPAGGSVSYNNVKTTDPICPTAGTCLPAFTAATQRLGFDSLGNCLGTADTVCAITSPTGPSVSGGTALTLSSNKMTGSLPSGCSTSSSKSPWAITCTGTGPFTFGALTMGGGSSATFTNTSSGATYNFSGLVKATSSNGLTFNGGSGATYNLAAGIVTGGAAPLTFSAGTFNIGASTAACNSSTGYSICDASTLTLGGPSTFVLAGGIYVGGGSTLTMGSGSTNSYNIGKANDGYSIAIGGGAITTLGDATGAGDLFQTAGNITNGGSSAACLALPAAAEHDINGYVSLACGATLGAGIYTVAGYVAIGCGSGGGTVAASDVSLVIGGATVPASGSCSGLAFYVGAGFSNVSFTAPSSGTMQDLAVIGPTSSSPHSSAGALFTGGSSGTTITGAFYLPNGAVDMSGSGTINNGGGCLEFVGLQVTLTGGSAATSTCTGLGGGSSGSSGSVALVQ